jgi:hypothetical protein
MLESVSQQPKVWVYSVEISWEPSPADLIISNFGGATFYNWGQAMIEADTETEAMDEARRMIEESGHVTKTIRIRPELSFRPSDLPKFPTCGG